MEIEKYIKLIASIANTAKDDNKIGDVAYGIILKQLQDLKNIIFLEHNLNNENEKTNI